MMTLYMVASGASDPTRASIPLHLALNGSLRSGTRSPSFWPAMPTELVNQDVRDRVEGIGVPPVRELLAKARQHEVPVYV